MANENSDWEPVDAAPVASDWEPVSDLSKMKPGTPVFQPSGMSSGQPVGTPDNPDWDFTAATGGGLPGLAAQGMSALSSKVIEPAAAYALNAIYQSQTGTRPDSPNANPIQPSEPLIPDELLPLAKEKGVIPALTRALQGFSTPGSVLTLPFAAESKLMQGFYLTGAATSIPQSVQLLAQAKTPEEAQDAATELGVNLAMGAMMAKGLKPKEAKFQGPLATGAVLRQPEGALPPKLNNEAPPKPLVADFAPTDQTEEVLPPPEAPTTPAEDPKPPEAVLTPGDATSSPTATQDIKTAIQVADKVIEAKPGEHHADIEERVQTGDQPVTEGFVENGQFKTREQVAAEHPEIQTTVEPGKVHTEDLTKLPQLPKGEKLVTVQKSDGTTYPAASSGKVWPGAGPNGEDVPAIAKLVNGAWSHGMLAPGEKIISQPEVEAAKNAPVSGVKPAPEQSLEKSATSETGKPTAMVSDKETVEIPLEMESDAQQAAREAQEAAVAKTKTDKENLAQQAAKPLVGSVGDIGQGDLLGGDTPTAMKYRMIDAERAKRGLPPITKPESVSDQALMDKAMGEIDRNPRLPNDLVQELLKKPRTIEPWERMVLLLHKLDLRENYERSARDAAQAYDDSKQFPDRNADMLRHNIETARLSNELTDLERASRISGSETGRALRALRIMANEDYSLAGLETSARAAKGGAPITIEERAQLQKIADDYAKEAANSKGDALRARESEAEAKRRLDEILKQPKPEPVAPHVRLVADKLKGFFGTQAKSALERIKARRAEGRMFNDPGAILSGGKLSTEDMIDYADYGASKIFEKGIESAEMTAEWAKEMTDEIGDYIKPHLDAIWKASLKTFQDGFKKVVGTDEVTRKKVKHAVKQLTPDENKTRVSEIIQEKMKDGDLSSVATSVQQLAELFVESGIKTRDELIDAVHGVLSGMDETITRRDTMDAISGYGDFKQLSKDEVSVTLRDLKRQMQEVAKLEDMAGGTSPKKTGIERAEWSKEQARLQKLVNDAKFNFQVPSTDPRTQLQSALDTFKKRTQGRIDDFQRRIAEGDFSKKPRRELTLDPEALRSKANLEAIKRKFDGMKEKWRRESLPGGEKVLDWVSAVRRFDALSGVSVLFKLAAYTATKIPTMAAEEIAGHVLQRLPGIRQIASKAPSEGAASLSILSRSVAKGFTKGMVDAYNVGTKGHSEIKSAFSTRPEIARHWTDVPVIIHEIIKSPLRRTSFENSLAKRMEHAAKNGADITDPVTQLRLAQEAYLDSDRDLLLEKNRVASGIRSFLKRMEQPNKATGKVPIYAKAAATIGRIETPVLSVPFNFAKQALTAAFGLISGSVRAREAFKVGIDNLKPEEADAIMRHLKMGSIGGAVALFGFIDGWNNYNTPQNSTFGGYYQQGEKREPGQAGVGGMKIGETKIPGLFLHNPVLSVGQLGYTVGSILHQKMQKEGIGNAMMVAPLVGFVGLVNDSPVGRQVELLTQLGNAGTADYGLGEHLKGILVPQLLNEIARQSDQPNLDLKKFLTGTAMKRYPKTPIQHIKTAIPGLRQTVPNTKKNVMSE